MIKGIKIMLKPNNKQKTKMFQFTGAKRLYYKIKNYFKSDRKDPVKECSYYKNNGCVHVDGYLCPCEETNEKENSNDKR